MMNRKRTKIWMQTGVGKIVAYFLQGLLLIAPTFLTFFALYLFFDFFDSHVNDLFEKVLGARYPGLGILAAFAFITLIGFVGSLVLVQPLLHIIDLILEKTPVVKDIYTAVKDFFSAFISNKKKFNKPVMFEMGKGTGVFKLGFITQEDMSELNILDKVAIYTPLSYNLSGIMYVVNKDQVQVLNDVGSAEMMKFILSGGVTEIEEDEHHHLPPSSPVVK